MNTLNVDKVHYLITGGTGLIGSALIASLPVSANIVVLSRQSTESALKKIGRVVHLIKSFDEIRDITEIDVIINLAGEPIADKSWSTKRKRDLRESRIGLTEKLAEMTQRLKRPVNTLVNGSAIGYYGMSESTVFSEKSGPGQGFSADMCVDWERTALAVNAERLCLLRTGIVLSKKGGMLKKLHPSFRFGFGAVLGDGRQMMSWIHVSDVVEIIQMMIKDASMEGAFNITSPNPITNSDFSDGLAKALSAPRFLCLPAWFVKRLFGERESLLLDSQNVTPSRLLELDYSFNYPSLEDALTEIYSC